MKGRFVQIVEVQENGEKKVIFEWKLSSIVPGEQFILEMLDFLKAVQHVLAEPDPSIKH